MEELSAPASVSNKVVGTEFYRPPHPSILTPSTSYEDTEGNAFVKPMTSAMMVDEKIDVFALGVLLFELLWRFETKSERFVVLTTLTRVGVLPAGFCDMVDRPGTSGTDCRRSEGKEVWEPPGVDAADRQPGRQSLKLANIIAECIAGMVHSNPAERWDCARVKKCIEGVLEMC
jgi:eukaryotic translation initiation factor 2-alpha kinase 3